MAVNVTEKDKTLNEIIDWCEQMEANRRPTTAVPCSATPATCPRKYRIKARTRNEQSNPICRVHPLRRDGGHILRDLPVLRIQTGCAQSATKGEMCGLTQVTTD